MFSNLVSHTHSVDFTNILAKQHSKWSTKQWSTQQRSEWSTKQRSEWSTKQRSKWSTKQRSLQFLHLDFLPIVPLLLRLFPHLFFQHVLQLGSTDIPIRSDSSRYPTFSPSLSMKPTVIPSLSPSLSFSSQWSKIIETYSQISAMSRGEESTSELLYYDLSLDHRQELGSCVEWGVLLKDALPLSLLRFRPLSLELSGMSGTDMVSLVPDASISSDTLLSRMRRVKCGDLDVVSNLLRSLIEFGGTNVAGIRSFQCGPQTWSVLRCPGSLSSASLSNSVVLCVNCTDYCTSSISAFTVSCSDAASALSPYGELSNLFVSFGDLFVAPSILSRNVNSGRDNLTITALLSGPGSLVCRGYEVSNANDDSLSPGSSDELILGGTPVVGVAVSSSSNVVSVTYSLTGLTASSSYNLYCATLSPSLAPMSPSEMLRSLMIVETRCCRMLEVRLNRLSFDDVSDLPFALTIDVGVGKVKERLVVKVTVLPISNTTSLSTLDTTLMFVPPILTFSSTSQDSSADLTYIHRQNKAGRYSLNVSVFGESSGDYDIWFSSGSEFEVKVSEDPVPGPLMKKATFSSYGSKILVTFVGSTNEGGFVKSELAKSCSKLFNFSKSSLSPSSSPMELDGVRCVWADDKSLELSPASALSAGDVLFLKSGVLKARCTSKTDLGCSSWPFTVSHNLTVSVPSLELLSPPVVTLSTPSELGVCDDLLLDLSSSSGSGGREWKSLLFKVTILSAQTSVSSSSSLQQYLSNLTARSSHSTSSKSLSSLIFSHHCPS
jgi:hypothetical protein